jgi:alpha-beta hydrolase superfamily lysophospholipase
MGSFIGPGNARAPGRRVLLILLFRDFVQGGMPVSYIAAFRKVLRKADYKTDAKVVLIGHSLGGI